jgi:hypothetical protein
MLTRAYFSAILLASLPVFPQAVSPLNSASASDSDQMATPPPVSGQAYPSAVEAEQRSNYLRGGMTFNTSYIDNLYPGNGAAIGETTYSVLPMVGLDQTTSLRHLTLSYSPGFTFYQPTSALNEVDQNANVTYRVRLTPHSALNLNDGFQDSSTSFGSANSAVGGSVSGSVTTIAPGIFAPFAKLLTNNAGGEFTLQISRNGMLGVSGTATTLHYPDSSEAQGLFDSSSRGGSIFYDHRSAGKQYLGVTYEYAQILAYPASAVSTTVLQSLQLFYSLYFSQSLSLSVSAGPQNYQVTEAPFPSSNSWAPTTTASMGWQGLHTNFAASYSEAVTAGDGLLGAYDSKSANASARWQISRTWTAGVSAEYAINKSISEPLSFGSENGHTVSGSATVQHPIKKQVVLGFEYDRIQQSYGGIPAISNNPDADRISASISWEFMRPLGQ